jgi:ubiquinol-cytochrome c reductase cytochrome c1 subunit
MNKELKILGIVAAFTLILYWGVEPFAHSQMHKHVEGHGLVYYGKADIEEASKDKK